MSDDYKEIRHYIDSVFDVKVVELKNEFDKLKNELKNDINKIISSEMREIMISRRDANEDIDKLRDAHILFMKDVNKILAGVNAKNHIKKISKIIINKEPIDFGGKVHGIIKRIEGKFDTIIAVDDFVSNNGEFYQYAYLNVGELCKHIGVEVTNENKRIASNWMAKRGMDRKDRTDLDGRNRKCYKLMLK